MQALAQFAEAFIGVFQQGGETFMGLVTGIVRCWWS
jgi:sorbitol-specific phosphotransferase system component IIC